MPFDPSGNFTRDYNWTTDRGNGVKVRADRMDGEFNNFATAMNQVLLRSGAAALTGNLNMGGNSIVSLADGSVGTPAIRFLGSPTSGVYSPGLDRVSLTASGTNRVEANATGALVTGTFGVSGVVTLSSNLTVGGNATVAATTFTAGLNVSGNSAVGGNATVTGTTLTSGLNVSGNSSFSGVTTHTGAATFNAATFNSLVTLNSTSSHIGAATFSDNVTVSGTTLTAGLNVSGNSAFGGLSSHTGAATFASTVGITGAATLNNTLNVSGAATFGSSLGVTGLATLNSLGVTNAATVGTTLGVSGAATFSSTLGVNGTVTIGSILAASGANPLAFYTNGAERARFDANGNFGIGTSTPANNAGYGGLTIGGTTGSILTFFAPGVTGRVLAGGSVFQFDTTSNTPLVFGVNASERVRVDTNGYLGIGTSSPSNKLHAAGSVTVLGQTHVVARFADYPGAPSDLVMGSVFGTTPFIGATGANPLTFYSNNTERGRFDVNGNFGVGTTAPINTVGYGGATISGSSGGVLNLAVGGASYGRVYADASGMSVQSTAGVPIYFGVGGASKVAITSGGEMYFLQSQVPTQTLATGYLGIPQVGGAAKTGNYTAVLADAGQHILMNGAGLTATIPSNAAVPYPVGTTLTFVNDNAASLTISINTDTMILAGSTTTGSRTLSVAGIATAIKTVSNKWIISGPGLS